MKCFILFTVSLLLMTEVRSSVLLPRLLPTGPAILVEYGNKNIKYGICSFFVNGEEMQVEYERIGSVMTAQSNKPDLVDPIFRANQCRMAAEKNRRNGARNLTPLNEDQINRANRMKSELDNKMIQLGRTPRFGGTFSPWGFSFGSFEKLGTNNFPQFGFPSLKGVLINYFNPQVFEFGEPAGQIDLTVK